MAKTVKTETWLDFAYDLQIPVAAGTCLVGHKEP